jgi:hypothetical protein
MNKRTLSAVRFSHISFAVAFSLFATICLPLKPLAAATDPVKLVIGGSGSSPWNVENIMPGMSGMQVITVQNSGSVAGNLTIWVSNVVNTEGTPPQFQPDPGPEGDLGDYLVFSVLSPRISSNIAMPALIGNLPQTAGDSDYIKVHSLASGETVTINWSWSLPADTGNIAQGDSLLFDINYMLEQVAPLPTTTTPPLTTTTTPTTSTAPTTTEPTTTVTPTTTIPVTTPTTTFIPTTTPVVPPTTTTTTTPTTTIAPTTTTITPTTTEPATTVVPTTISPTTTTTSPSTTTHEPEKPSSPEYTWLIIAIGAFLTGTVILVIVGRQR